MRIMVAVTSGTSAVLQTARLSRQTTRVVAACNHAFTRRPSQFAGAALQRHFHALLGNSDSVRYERTSSARRSLPVVYAGWGDPVDWSKAKVLHTTPAAEGLKQLVVDIGPLGAGYNKAGQYLQIKVGDSKPAFYAIASPPDPNNQGVIELLVKNQGDTAEILCQLESGAEIDVSPVQGKGFPVEKAPASSVSTLYMFATGTGIAPVKALIESDTLDIQSRKDVRLYYGTFNEDATAYKDLVPAWEASGLKVQLVFSDEKAGYVQDAFAKDNIDFEGGSAGAVLCGQKEMNEAVVALLAERGVSSDCILKNF